MEVVAAEDAVGALAEPAMGGVGLPLVCRVVLPRLLVEILVIAEIRAVQLFEQLKAQGRQIVERQVESPLRRLRRQEGDVVGGQRPLDQPGPTVQRPHRRRFVPAQLEHGDVGIVVDPLPLGRVVGKRTMRNGRRGENFRPVENENSSRHSSGRQLSSPAISCAGERLPETARHAASHAACTSAAMFAGPGSVANCPSSGWSTGRRRSAIESGSSLASRKPARFHARRSTRLETTRRGYCRSEQACPVAR